MQIEEIVFAKKKVRFDSLLAHGFTVKGDSYYYREKIVDDTFEVIVKISKSGAISGQVIDLDLEEEYLAFRAEQANGAFVGQVREAYQQILEHIAGACFQALPFTQAQTNRLANHLTRTFGDPTDHPFAKFSSFTAFRHPDNLKWYGLVGKVQRGKLQLGQESWDADALKEQVEMINIKVDPSKLADLLKEPSIYPAYHMSKKSWITIVCDDRLSDDLLFTLVEESRRLVAPKTVTNPSGSEYWIIPANMRNFDIDRAFAASRDILWTQKKSIKKGDTLLIYITAPTKAVRYVCQVLEDHIEGSEGVRMRLRLVNQLGDSGLDWERLKALGVTSIRGPRRLTAEAISYLEGLLK